MTDAPDNRAAACCDLVNRLRPAWSRFTETDQVLAPWGSCTALDAVTGLHSRDITHGWDLAVAMGQPSDALDAAAHRCLFFGADLIPARPRGVMYDDAVRTSTAAPATERLASALGRYVPTTTAGRESPGDAGGERMEHHDLEAAGLPPDADQSRCPARAAALRR